MKTKTLLVIDDDATMRKLVRSCVSKYYTVLEAEDGESGLELARQNKPDLIIMDIIMPRMNGLEACRRIKAESHICNIPIIILTANDYETNLNRVAAVGASEYLTKPIAPQELLKKVRTLLESTSPGN